MESAAIHSSEVFENLPSIVFSTPASGACALKGWLEVLTQQSCDCLSTGALRNLLIACRFFAIFLVVSIKKRNFGGRNIN